MNHTLTNFGEIITVGLEGELTSRCYPRFEEKLKDECEQGNKIVFIMDGVEFIDSIGVVFLLRMRELVDGNGGFFAMYDLRADVERVLRRLRLEKVLHVYKSAEECFASMLSDDLKFEESPLIEIDEERKLVKLSLAG